MKENKRKFGYGKLLIIYWVVYFVLLTIVVYSVPEYDPRNTFGVLNIALEIIYLSGIPLGVYVSTMIRKNNEKGIWFSRITIFLAVWELTSLIGKFFR